MIPKSGNRLSAKIMRGYMVYGIGPYRASDRTVSGGFERCAGGGALIQIIMTRWMTCRATCRRKSAGGRGCSLTAIKLSPPVTISRFHGLLPRLRGCGRGTDRAAIMQDVGVQDDGA